MVIVLCMHACTSRFFVPAYEYTQRSTSYYFITRAQGQDRVVASAPVVSHLAFYMNFCCCVFSSGYFSLAFPWSRFTSTKGNSELPVEGRF